MLVLLRLLIYAGGILASELKPMIPEIVERDTPAVVAYYEVITMMSNPTKLTNTIDRRSLLKDLPLRRFYTLLKAHRDNPDLKGGWDCAKKVRLSSKHAADISRLVSAKADGAQLKKILESIDSQFDVSVSTIRIMEAIKHHDLNYHPSLIELARQRMHEVTEACPGLKKTMNELEQSLLLKPEDIKEDNEMLGDEGEVDRAPLIAMTVIGIASIVLNILQGIIAAKKAPKKEDSPTSELYKTYALKQ